MTHQQFKEWIHLSLYNELNERDEYLLQEHLMACASCRHAFEQAKRMHETLAQTPRARFSEQMLQEARQGLRVALRYEQAARPSIRQRLADTVAIWKGWLAPAWRSRYAYALGGLVLFALGLFIGSRGVMPGETPLTGAAAFNDADLLSRGDVEISNVRFLDSDAADGDVEFVFEAVRPIYMKGRIVDPRVQKVLAYTVVNEQNPGVRLRAVNVVAASRQAELDDEIKQALITALKTDPNPGVRKEAFTSLMKFPFDQPIKEALLFVLTNDTNAALRIEAINRLDARTDEQRRPDQDVVNVLRARMETDENAYIRGRARMVLEEMGRP